MDLDKLKLKFWNFWPPLFFSGIKITYIAKDFREIKVRLKLRFWNANYVGTAFGGSLFAMSDAFYMVMLIQNLGKDYVVWDKAAQIKYLKPGKTDVYADFKITDEDLATIHKALDKQEKLDWEKKVEIFDKHGTLVAEVNRVLYIRKKIKTPEELKKI